MSFLLHELHYTFRQAWLNTIHVKFNLINDYEKRQTQSSYSSRSLELIRSVRWPIKFIFINIPGHVVYDSIFLPNISPIFVEKNKIFLHGFRYIFPIIFRTYTYVCHYFHFASIGFRSFLILFLLTGLFVMFVIILTTFMLPKKYLSNTQWI